MRAQPPGGTLPFRRPTIDTLAFARLLRPIAVIVFVLGWALALAAFFIIGTESCATVAIPIAGNVEACDDTTADSVILLTVIGFAATVGSIFLWALSHLLYVLAGIESNTRR
jgi:hypothetical protein